MIERVKVVVVKKSIIQLLLKNCNMTEIFNLVWYNVCVTCFEYHLLTDLVLLKILLFIKLTRSIKIIAK